MNLAGAARTVQPSDAVAVAIIVAVFAAGVAVYDMVPAEMVVHYTPPGGVYYGAETLPKEFGLFVVPVLMLLSFGGARLLPVLAGLGNQLGVLCPYYYAGLAGVVILLGTVQAALILLNV